MRTGSFLLAALALTLVSACGHEQAAPTAQASPTLSASSQPSQTVTAAPAATASPARTDHTSSSSPRPSHPATARSSASPTIVLVTDADNGRTVHLRPLDRLEVRLGQDSYDPPASSSPALARRTSSGGYPTADPVDALFEARARGTADVSSSSDYACFHTSPRCLRPTRLWSVHVVID